MMLGVLIKSHLRHLRDAVVARELRRLATRLEREWRGAAIDDDAARPLARLGRVLLVKLDNLSEPPDP